MGRLIAISFLAVLFGLFASPVAVAAPLLPNFAAATFVAGASIDNPYFPLLDDLTRTYAGRDGDGNPIDERFELRRLGLGPVILGVQTTTRRDRAYEEGLLVEETFDFYAQDTAGNVWYFGEDVTNYVYDADGNLIGTNNASAWRAGVNGAQPGYALPIDLTIGFNYYQEFAALDEALDQGTTHAVGETVSIGIGVFTDVLRVLETTELDLDFREFKFYAPGVGLIFAQEHLDANLENPDVIFELVSTVPEPAALPILAFGLAGAAVLRRRRGAQPASPTTVPVAKLPLARR